VSDIKTKNSLGDGISRANKKKNPNIFAHASGFQSNAGMAAFLLYPI